VAGCECNRHGLLNFAETSPTADVMTTKHILKSNIIMKKFFIGACAALAVLATSCGNETQDSKSVLSPELADSISTYYGKSVGNYFLNDFARFKEQNADQEVSKEDIIKGIQTVFAAGTNKSTLMGMSVATQILNEIQSLEEQGIVVDRDTFIKNFKENFMQDSVSMETMQATGATMQSLMKRAQDIAAKAAEEAKAEAPEAKKAAADGAAFVAAAKKKDPSIKTTESGLSYKITEQGQGDTPKENDTVLVHYTGKLIDGTVFDSSVERGEPAKFPLQGVVPGFREGLMLLGKGGKATLYIPAELAYGVNGVPQANIGPNATLIFEVELIDINPQD
jgi:FKBP-type peptidyl-prolyl cis-trans isomerase